MTCRRCGGHIGAAEVAHVVNRHPDLDAVAPLNIRCVAVCTGCLDPAEKQFVEEPEPLPPPLRLRPMQEVLLRHALLGDTVYRQPRKVRLRTGGALLDTDRAVTTDAYIVINLGFAEWDVVPRPERVEGGATAWLRVTAEGSEYLLMEDCDVVAAGSR